MWFWISILVIIILYFMSPLGKQSIQQSMPDQRVPQNNNKGSNKQSGQSSSDLFNDPRKMSKDEYMRFRGYDPADPQDRMAAKDDDKPEDCLFDAPICIWRDKRNVTIEYDGGTADQPRNVDLLELNLNRSADSLVFTAFCHLRNAERHFIAEKITNIEFDGKIYDVISFCHDVLELPVFGKNDNSGIVIFADSIGGIPFNASKHFNRDDAAKLARKIRKAKNNSKLE